MNFDKIDLLGGNLTGLVVPASPAAPLLPGQLGITPDRNLSVALPSVQGWTTVATPRLPVPVGDLVRFSNASKLGRIGPTKAELDAVYAGTNILNLGYDVSAGIQSFGILGAGVYEIVAQGACGGFARIGTTRLVVVTGRVTLAAGDTLRILVGQRPVDTTNGNTRVCGGGGASFVVSQAQGLLVVAGGTGGGAGLGTNNQASITNNASTTSSPWGLNGQGGISYTENNGVVLGGSGWAGKAADVSGRTSQYTAAETFTQGGRGATTSFAINSQGGFGGGGAAGCPATGTWEAYGGGGGYSGGSAAGTSTGSSGGGSFLVASATNRSIAFTANLSSGSTTLQGYVTLRRIS